MSALSRVLARLAEKRVAGVSAPEFVPVETRREEVGVESFLPGGEITNAFGKLYLHERLRSEIEKPSRKWGKYPSKPSTRAFLHDDLSPFATLGAGSSVFFDLETCGLSNAPVFLAGTMHWNGSDYVVRQYFARHYGEEAALVDEVARFLAGFETVISYNGKSYDVPFMADRASLHHVSFERPSRHVDLVHHARRRWNGILPNCRLVTLEAHVCGRYRSGDIPSAEVPGLYHDYVRNGGAHRLIPVFHHNLLDVTTMDEILRALVGDPPPQICEEELPVYDFEEIYPSRDG